MARGDEHLVGLDDEDAARLLFRLLDENGAILDAPDPIGPDQLRDIVVAAHAMGVRLALNSKRGRAPCRICGCWELEACEGGCCWAQGDLCSACGPEVPITWVVESPEAQA